MSDTSTSTPHLEEWQVERIESYMRDLLKALGLSNWRLIFDWQPPASGLDAQITPRDGTRWAALRVSKAFWDDDPDWKTLILTHEALHLTHHDTEEGIRRFFREYKEVPPELARMVKSTMVTNFERMVDGLSFAIGRHMPQWKAEWDETPQQEAA